MFQFRDFKQQMGIAVAVLALGVVTQGVDEPLASIMRISGVALIAHGCIRELWEAQ